MRSLINALTIGVISLLTPVIVQTQTLNPPYLSEMPAPARILAEIRGKDGEDSGERQMGAFKELMKMIDDMAYGLEHRFDTQLRPDEERIKLAYYSAYADLWHKVKDTYGKQYAADYDQDRDLQVELLDKFFSANFRAQYFKTNGFAAAWYQKVHANGATSATGESPNQGAGSAKTPETLSSRGVDPSIAKARAANVDTTVYGLQMGGPLRLPTCPQGAGLPGATPVPATCFYEEDALSKQLGEIFGGAGNEPERDPHEIWKTVYVHNGPRVFVLFYDGLLATVHLDTGGIDDDSRVAKELRQKYGPPTVVKPFTYTPRIGNTLKADDLEWSLPGLHVAYSAVLKNATRVISVDGGSVNVETEAAYQRRLAKEKAQQRTKM